MTKEEADILLRRARFILTVDPERPVTERGAVAVKDGVVVAIGEDERVAREYEGEEVNWEGNVALCSDGGAFTNLDLFSRSG